MSAMKTLLRNFLKSESGAITVDWVVLTAAIVGLGLAAVASVHNSTNGLSERVGNAVAISTLGTDGE
jgi:Flp pilus assembly pilin Flp